MIHGFTHSISLSMSPRRRAKTASHARSVSLPRRSHPLIANLHLQISTVRSWAAGGDCYLAYIEAGLSHVELLLSVVHDCLNLSEMRTMLQHGMTLTECLLENFMYLADSFGSFLSDLVTLKQHQFEVQSALRRHDSVLLASSLKFHKKIEKDLSHLAASMRNATKCRPLMLASDALEDELLGVLKEAIGATSSASAILLNRVVAISAAASTEASSSSLCTVRPFKKKNSNKAMEMLLCVKFEELEECVRIVEIGSQRVLRRLVNSRVELLNIQSNSF